MKRPLVVKLGSSLVVDERGRPRRTLLRGRAAEIAEIVDGGTPVCVVSSGAIALGLRRARARRGGRRACRGCRPRRRSARPRSSARGRTRSRPHGLDAAQILLTAPRSRERRAYVNVRSALDALFALGAVPVVNENDATATDEISFGDNDALAAQVAVLVRARLLVLLTSVPGVLARGRADRGRRGRALGRVRPRQRRSGAAGWRARSPPPSSRPARASRR